MGTKTKTLIATLLLVLPVCNVNASTPDEIYSVYGKSYSATVSENVSNVLRDYNDAVRSAYMYKGITSVDIETGYNTYTKSLKELEYHREKLTAELDKGFDLTYEDILTTETELKETEELIAKYKKYLSQKLRMPSIKIGNVPTQEQYTEAKKLSTLQDVGSIQSLPHYSILRSSNDSTTLDTPPGTNIKVFFDGQCILSNDDTCIIDSGYNIHITYKNLGTNYCKVGDWLQQGDYVGTSYNKNVSITMKLDNESVNLATILKEATDVQNIRN